MDISILCKSGIKANIETDVNPNKTGFTRILGKQVGLIN